MNPKVDAYLIEGCGRCDLFNTPACKVNDWRNELIYLRSILQECGLDEDLKWGIPCYTFNGKNIVLLSAFKNYAALNFFNGALLKDAENILVKPGEQTQAGRQIRFTSIKQVTDLETTIKEYLFEAIEVEKAGLKIKLKKSSEYVLPEELLNMLDDAPDLKTAFYALTPGRQRGYIIYFSAPKQSKTRVSRIKKYIPHILNGKGFHDR